MSGCNNDLNERKSSEHASLFQMGNIILITASASGQNPCTFYDAQKTVLYWGHECGTFTQVKNVISVTGQMRATQRTHYFQTCFWETIWSCVNSIWSHLPWKKDRIYYSLHNIIAGLVAILRWHKISFEREIPLLLATSLGWGWNVHRGFHQNISRGSVFL